MRTTRAAGWTWSGVVLALTILSGCGRLSVDPDQVHLDVSGLAWVAADTFLAVHDGKNPEEADRPRLSLVFASADTAAVRRTPLNVVWPVAQGLPHDLESLAHIPGTRTFIAAESGDDGEGGAPRLFLLRLEGTRAVVLDVVPWFRPVTNVEGTAVGRVGEALRFVYAERAHGDTETDVCWADMDVSPLQFEPAGCLPLIFDDQESVDFRPVSALTIDAQGRLFGASTTDPGERGPFRSDLWTIGHVTDLAAPAVSTGRVLQPRHVTRIDGHKVEGLTRAGGTGTFIPLVIGTDDEDLGGVVRFLGDAAAD